MTGLIASSASGFQLPLLRASRIVRRYGQSYALRGVDLRVEPGERVVLLGPNGAGKTTLIRVLATALRPASGQVSIAGIDAAGQPALARGMVGMVGHQTCLYGDMTVRENLHFYGRLYAVEELDRRVTSVLEAVDLSGRAGDLVRTLSRGLQQRASVARAILHRPKLLLLDEPETGLDDAAQLRLGELLTRWAEDGGGVLMATHRLEWAQTLADRVVVLENGRVVDTFATPQGAPHHLATAYRAAIGGIGGAATCADPLDLAGMPGQAEAASAADPASGRATLVLRGRGPAHFVKQLVAVLAKDLRIEWRTKDALSAMLVFSFLVLVTFNFALDLRPEVMAAVGPGVLWVAVVFASTLGLGRTFAVERDQGTLDGLLMAPLDRGALFLAKLTSNLVFMLALEVVSLPTFAILFNVPLDPIPVMGTLALGAVGLAAVGTLSSAIAAHTRAREVMLPVLLFPLIVPILIGVVQATGLVLGSGVARDMPWLSLIAAFAVMYVAAGTVAFDYVLEE